MIWSGDLPNVETLKENIVAYFNILQGFLLVCHGSMVGAGPTLHKSICGSAKNVVDSSFSLFKHAVSAYGMLKNLPKLVRCCYFSKTMHPDNPN